MAARSIATPSLKNKARSPSQVAALADARKLARMATLVKHGAPLNSNCGVRIDDRQSQAIGVKYGQLCVEGVSFRIPSPNRKSLLMVVVRCDCGAFAIKPLAKIKCGHVASCGCAVAESVRASTVTHGLTKHPLYRVWQAMKRRCHDPNDKHFHLYGGRGIGVSQEWQRSFKAFYDWAIRSGWRRGLEIDRYPDQSGDYCENNCRIATRQMQANNCRTNRVLFAFGETKTVAEWSRDSRCSVSADTLRARLNDGWDNETAITKPNRFSGITLKEPA